MTVNQVAQAQHASTYLQHLLQNKTRDRILSQLWYRKDRMHSIPKIGENHSKGSPSHKTVYLNFWTKKRKHLFVKGIAL